ncbi:MAG: hypothetical protein AAF368_02890 [Planctomycetota bacterium]
MICKPCWILLLGSLSFAAASVPAIAAMETLQEGATLEKSDAKMATDAKFEAFKKEADAALKAWESKQQKRWDALRAEGKQDEFELDPSPLPDFIERAQEQADELAGTEGAAGYLAWMGVNAMREDETIAKDSIEALVADHITSPHLAMLSDMMPYFDQIFGDKAKGMLERMEKESPIPAVKGWAMLARVKAPLEEASKDSEEYKSMKAALLALVEESGDEGLKSSVDSLIRLKELLGVGCIAPDIVGPDLDGVEFKLSDYRGKVVFLDFWGDW